MNTLKERFEEKFIKGLDDECWEWKRGTDRFGYGRILVNGLNEVAHRVSYRLYKGNPDGLFVCHTCDNPPCVNPNHLFLGTLQDKNRDATLKSKFVKKIPRVYYQIMLDAIDAGFTQYEIAGYFGVRQPLVSRLKTKGICGQ